MTKAGKFCTGPQRSKNEAGFLWRTESISGFSSNLSACKSQFVNTIFNSIFSQIGPVGAKCICLNRIHADCEVCIMNRTDQVRPGDIENFVATFVVLEIFKCGIGCLKHRSHGSIGDDSSARQGSTQETFGHSRWSLIARHGAEVTVRCRCGDSSNSSASFASNGYRLFGLE